MEIEFGEQNFHSFGAKPLALMRIFVCMGLFFKKLIV
jgi:hypothetical protein